MDCKYFENINGVNGNCTANPPIKITHNTSGGWEFPIVTKGCECRFYKPAVDDNKLTVRQKALLAKKEAEKNLQK